MKDQLTVVVEYDDEAGDGGAYEVGRAPAGSNELRMVCARARREAREQVRANGGWASVFVGVGDVETVNCETAECIYGLEGDPS